MVVPDNYRLFKFKSGEDVIAACFEAPEDKINVILDRPMQISIIMTTDGSGNPVPAKLLMTEWMAFCKEDTAVVPRDNILVWGRPTELVAGIYDTEKKRLDELRAKAAKTPPPNELDKTDEQTAAEKAAEKRLKRKQKQIVIQMSLESLMRFLESVGLDIDDEPWRTMVNPDDDDDDAMEEETECPENIDGGLDIMPDVDGDGFVDPYGNKWDGPGPAS